jgi:hypothetical protein
MKGIGIKRPVGSLDEKNIGAFKGVFSRKKAK